MATLSDLRDDILKMPRVDALKIIMDIRFKRRQPDMQRTKVAVKKKVNKQIDNLTNAEKLDLIAKLEGLLDGQL